MLFCHNVLFMVYSRYKASEFDRSSLLCMPFFCLDNAQSPIEVNFFLFSFSKCPKTYKNNRLVYSVGVLATIRLYFQVLSGAPIIYTYRCFARQKKTARYLTNTVCCKRSMLCSVDTQYVYLEQWQAWGDNGCLIWNNKCNYNGMKWPNG